MSDQPKKPQANNESGLSTDDFSTDGSEIEIVGEEGKQKEQDEAPNNEAAQKISQEFLYLRAEFENFKRQAIKERSDLVKYGNERLIVELLNIVDIFDAALQTELTAENIDSFKQGMEMTASELRGLLTRFGVNCIDPKGEAFDPTLHEALSSEPSSEIEPGYISQVFKKAYKLHDRVIRPAQVVVAREPDKDS